MKFKQLVKLCYNSNNNIRSIKIEAETIEAQKIISSNPHSVVLSSITVPIQNAYEDDELAELEVLGIDIKDDQTLIITI